MKLKGKVFKTVVRPGAKTIKKITNSTQNKSLTHCAKQYKVTSFLSTYWELSTETCSKTFILLAPGLLYGQRFGQQREDTKHDYK